MPSVRAQKHRYARRTFAQGVSGPIKSGAEDLLGGVLQAFPKADATRLQAWLQDLIKRPQIEREAVLFITLVCGTRFAIYHPQVNEVLRQLWEWFTWSPRNMPRELADLVVDVLAPKLEGELRVREGWRVGPSDARTKKLGRPPTSRGAWVAALTADAYLRDKGLGPADSIERALELAAILTGRDTAAPEELRRARRALGEPNVEHLCTALEAQFEWWVRHDGMTSGDAEPSAATQAWRKRHCALASVLRRYGAQSFGEEVVKRLPDELWGTAGPVRPDRRARPASKGSRKVLR